MYIVHAMKRRNISWSDEVERTARALAVERGMPLSQLLSQLVEAENEDARVLPSGDVRELSPGMKKLLGKKKGG